MLRHLFLNVPVSLGAEGSLERSACDAYALGLNKLLC